MVYPAFQEFIDKEIVQKIVAAVTVGHELGKRGVICRERNIDEPELQRWRRCIRIA